MNFSKKLTNWYAINKREFPWRKTTNPYFIWLSEIILQQTRTAQGLPYFENFTKNYPTIFDLANAKESQVLKLWQGLGYYSRARNLHYTAKYIVHELDGVFPKNYKELLKLKGVGDYTASAIASISYNEKCAVVDGNVYRVLSRYFGIETPINSSAGIKEFKLLAEELLPKDNFALHNQAIMDFGATICTPKKANCNICVFNESCFALQQNKVAALPVKTNKTIIKNRFFNYLVFLDTQNNTLINKRIKKGIWQNLYEFPLIETTKEINTKQLLMSDDFKVFLKMKPEKITLFNSKKIIHKLSHQHIYTQFWIVHTNNLLKKGIPYYSIKKHPVPVLINNFLKEFTI